MSKRTCFQFANSLDHLINKHEEFDTFKYKDGFNKKIKKAIESIRYMAPELLNESVAFGLIFQCIIDCAEYFTDQQHSLLKRVVEDNLRFECSTYKKT